MGGIPKTKASITRLVMLKILFTSSILIIKVSSVRMAVDVLEVPNERQHSSSFFFLLYFFFQVKLNKSSIW